MTDIAAEIPPGPWQETVSAMLPLPYRAAMPFTLAEAVDELGLWAKFARSDSWGSPKNRNSLFLDIAELSEHIGPRVRDVVRPLLDQLLPEATREDLAECAERFRACWRQQETVRAAFRDLCDASSRPDATAWDLRKLSNVLASQEGISASGSWSALSEAASALTGDRHQVQINEWFGEGRDVADITQAERLRVAEGLITTEPPAGNIVVWLVYRRAAVPFRVDAGPITFLRADWMVPNARRDDGQAFPERDELRVLLESAWWMKDLEAAIVDPANMLVLARVSLGTRAIAGAVEDASRRIEAILSIAVGAGGVSWQDTGSSAIVVDGRVATSSLGLDLGGRRQFDDTYGIHATSEVLADIAKRLDIAMASRPMPDYLVEALVALRESAMTEHRDVSFYGARAVTPRVSIALQDHATELIASVASMNPAQLAEALEAREVDWQFEQRMLGGIAAVFDRSSLSDDRVELRSIEREVVKYSGGSQVISISKALELQDKLLDLPVIHLKKVGLLDSLKAATDSTYEATLRENYRREVAMVRARHRRVRNAINHGNPLTTAALESTRAFAERTADAALAIALEAYASDTQIVSLLSAEQASRELQREGLASGRNYLDRNPAVGETNLDVD